MKHALLLLILMLSPCAWAEWLLDSSEVTFHVDHPLHKVDGTSKSSRGKGTCSKSECEFLVATPVKTFSSDNSNRDEHVLEVVRAALHPIVSVRFKTPNTQLRSPLETVAEIEFNGVKVSKKISILLKMTDSKAEAHGDLNLKMTEFKIEPPSLFTVAAKNDFVVHFESHWHK